MFCYRDMTFCTFWEDCALGKDCFRALTPKVREEAEKWAKAAGLKSAPICQYDTKSEPPCFKYKKD